MSSVSFEPRENAPGNDQAVARREADELIQGAREEMGLGPDRPWAMVAMRTKRGKLLLEVKEGQRHLVLKRHTNDSGADSFRILRQLWEAGFRPPAGETVVEPLAYLPERRLLVLEKAPGRQLVDAVRERSSVAELGLRRAAQWLARLQASGLDAPPCASHGPKLDRIHEELAALLPDQAERLGQLVTELRRSLDSWDGPNVPTHGDFHPTNIFHCGSGRTTVIDVDTYCSGEPAFDVGTLLAQSAIVGWFAHGRFAATAPLRRAFVDEYSKASGRTPEPERLCLAMGLALLQGLHHELCVSRTGRREMARPWLDAATRCVVRHDSSLT